MSDVIPCGCCGVPLNPPRKHVRRCEVCDLCDKLHGDALQIRLSQLVVAGKVDVWQAITRSLIDDAQLCGRLAYVGDPRAATLYVQNPPRRWEVAICRAICRGEQPDLNTAIAAALAPFFGRVWGVEVRIMIEREVTEVIGMFDDSITGVDIDIDADVFDPAHAVIKVNATTPALGTTFDDDAAGVIPADILSRRRAEA